MAEKQDSPQKFSYQTLFQDVADKAAAFDQIAEHFYERNFGSMSKSDMETLMFSIYINRILDGGDKNFNTYSDFRLAKELGITQSKVRNLKEKKQQQYPRDFKWREAFKRVSKNARYENGKIKIQIPDINLYYEIQNTVEENGGFIEVSLTPKLLQISPEYFLDLMMVIDEEGREREFIQREWRKAFRDYQKDQEFFDQESIGRQMAGMGKDVAVNVLSTVLSGIIAQGSAASLIRDIAENIKNILPVR